MDNDEVEFIAENELITVIPNFQYKTLYLIGVRTAISCTRLSFVI